MVTPNTKTDRQQCPNCKSTNLVFRESDNTFFCRACGQRTRNETPASRKGDTRCS
ncbi:MAG: TFIIB-type zinc ribbon-containing protein [Planctomycetes bacterium]|nr:TFIIB-type zinc ribbon-containing protein [Planctomycetota bacterium]